MLHRDTRFVHAAVLAFAAALSFLTCGNPGTVLDVPLGATTRQAACTVHAG